MHHTYLYFVFKCEISNNYVNFCFLKIKTVKQLKENNRKFKQTHMNELIIVASFSFKSTGLVHVLKNHLLQSSFCNTFTFLYIPIYIDVCMYILSS